DQYSFWHSTQSNNLSGFKNFRIDKLLEDGRKTLAEEERKNIYFDFQRFLVEESPVVFLIHPTVYCVSRP
ncbi:MAG: peptide-binding protein, partial [Microgenomates group bacterium]